MANVITKVPSAVSARYKYERYFDGQLWELVPGEDCPESIRSARTSISSAAKRRGIECKVSQSSEDNRIYVKAVVAKKRKAK